MVDQVDTPLFLPSGVTIPAGSFTGYLSLTFPKNHRPHVISTDIPIYEFPNQNSLYDSQLLSALLSKSDRIRIVTADRGTVFEHEDRSAHLADGWSNLQVDDIQMLCMYAFERRAVIRRLHDPWSWHDRVVQAGLGAFVNPEHLPILTPEQDVAHTYSWYMRDENTLKEQETSTEEEIVARVEGKDALWWTRKKRKRQGEEEDAEELLP